MKAKKRDMNSTIYNSRAYEVEQFLAAKCFKQRNAATGMPQQTDLLRDGVKCAAV